MTCAIQCKATYTNIINQNNLKYTKCSVKNKMFSNTRKVYTSSKYDNIKCVKTLWLIRAMPTSRPHIHNAVFCDTPENPNAFFHDLVCLCAFHDYPKVE